MKAIQYTFNIWYLRTFFIHSSAQNSKICAFMLHFFFQAWTPIICYLTRKTALHIGIVFHSQNEVISVSATKHFTWTLTIFRPINLTPVWYDWNPISLMLEWILFYLLYLLYRVSHRYVDNFGQKFENWNITYAKK